MQTPVWDPTPLLRRQSAQQHVIKLAEIHYIALPFYNYLYAVCEGAHILARIGSRPVSVSFLNVLLVLPPGLKRSGHVYGYQNHTNKAS